MTPTEEVELVRRLFTEVWSQPDSPVISEIVSPDFSSDDPAVRYVNISSLGEEPKGPDALAREMALYRTVYDDLQFTINDLVADDHIVVARWEAQGTHPTATLIARGGQEVRAQLRSNGVSVTRIEGGKIASSAMYWERDSSIIQGMR